MKDELRELATRAQIEFDDVLDYIWKSPRLIKHETELELEKLDRYFPTASGLAEIRWRHESRKLNSVFPYLIAVGNLFSGASVFECHLLRLAVVLEERTGKSVSNAKGQGVSKLFNYLKMLGVDPTGPEMWVQVQAALKIRNCFAHASGILAWSRDEQELRRIQKGCTYLSKEHRERRATSSLVPEGVSINRSELGERLQIDNGYAHTAAYYMREYFIALCQLTSACRATTPDDHF